MNMGAHIAFLVAPRSPFSALVDTTNSHPGHGIDSCVALSISVGHTNKWRLEVDRKDVDVLRHGRDNIGEVR